MNKDLEELRHEIMLQHFYEKYIMSEDEKMMRIIHENARKGKNDKMVEKRIKIRKWAVYVAISTISGAIGLIIGVLI